MTPVGIRGNESVAARPHRTEPGRGSFGGFSTWYRRVLGQESQILALLASELGRRTYGPPAFLV